MLEKLILHQDENYRTTYNKLGYGVMIYKEYYSKMNGRYEEVSRIFLENEVIEKLRIL